MSSEDQVDCPACGTQVPPESKHCLECGEAIDASTQVDQAYASPAAESRNMSTFGLGSLLLLITLIGVSLGLFMIEPGLGILALVLATPALVRTMIRINKGKMAGESLDPGQKLVAFIGSFGIMVATSVAVGVAFFVTCWGGFFAGAAIGEAAGQGGYDPLGTGFLVGLSAGGLAALICGVFVIRWLWPIRLK